MSHKAPLNKSLRQRIGAASRKPRRCGDSIRCKSGAKRVGFAAMLQRTPSVAAIILLVLLLRVPPVRRAGRWEPDGDAYSYDRILFGYGPAWEWVGALGAEWKLANDTS